MLISPSTVKSLILLYGEDTTLDELYSKICQEEGLDKESIDAQCAPEVTVRNMQKVASMVPEIVDTANKYCYKLFGT